MSASTASDQAVRSRLQPWTSPKPDVAAPVLHLVPDPMVDAEARALALAEAQRRRRMRVTAWTGIVAAVLCPLLTLVGGPVALALTGALLAAAVGAGPGVLCWIDAGDGVAQAGLTLVTSLALFAITATVLLWLHAWQTPLLWVPVGLSAVSCAVRLWGRR
jgi:hypothetical protein